MTQHTTPKDINARHRMNQAVALRLAGNDYNTIARACGYANRSSARKAVVRAMREIPVEHAQELRTIMYAQLNSLYHDHRELARKDVYRADFCRRVLADQARLMGLNIEPEMAAKQETTIIREVPSYLHLLSGPGEQEEQAG